MTNSTIHLHFNPEIVREFVLSKGWEYEGNWQEKIEYYSLSNESTKVTHHVKMPVSLNLKSFNDKMWKFLDDMAICEDVNTDDLIESLKKFTKGIPKIVEAPKYPVDKTTKKTKEPKVQFKEQKLFKEELDDVTETKDDELNDQEQRAIDRAVKDSLEKIEADMAVQRDSKGKFLKGNTVSASEYRNGISSGDVRRHRTQINNHVEKIIDKLIYEGLENGNMNVCMYLLNKVVPDNKAATFLQAQSINAIKSLTDLKDQSAITIKDSLEGEKSLEEAKVLMDLYKEHKALIEAADIEPLAQELAKRYGK